MSKIKVNRNYVFLFVLFLGISSSHKIVKQEVLREARQNIIYIYVDQLSANMMSCEGNTHLKTLALDYIANNSIRFTRSYATNPVCSPARVSLMSGRFSRYFKSEI